MHALYLQNENKEISAPKSRTSRTSTLVTQCYIESLFNNLKGKHRSTYTKINTLVFPKQLNNKQRLEGTIPSRERKIASFPTTHT